MCRGEMPVALEILCQMLVSGDGSSCVSGEALVVFICQFNQHTLTNMGLFLTLYQYDHDCNVADLVEKYRFRCL